MTPELKSLYMSPAELVAELRSRVGESWAGFPMPVPGFSMTIHERYPFAELFEQEFPDSEAGEEKPPDQEEVADEEEEVVNEWYQAPKGLCGHVKIFRTAEGRSRIRKCGPLAPLTRLVETLSACCAWDIHAELRAIKKLRRHLSPYQWHCYVLTGTFVETSPRSRLMYVFRRLRPTIACSFSSGHGRIIAILCSHPIGYYDDTWAGAMVPTDDLLSHLLLMRADEHYLWRISNQHQARDMGTFA
jgi:hypothetical protein